MATNDWACIISDPESTLPMISSEADDFLDVHFLGDDLLDIYGDAIDEAASDAVNQRKSSS